MLMSVQTLRTAARALDNASAFAIVALGVVAAVAVAFAGF
jgi:hypothetical protein